MSNKSRNIMIGVLAVGIVTMTVAFAALSTNLRINGTASVPNVSWNIHFVTPWTLDTQSTVNNHQNTAEYPSVGELQNSLSPNITLVEGLNVTLHQPGDYARYKFNIINEGTIDAELSSFTAPLTCTVGNNCDEVINYEVKCYDNQSFTGSELTTHSVLNKNGGLAYCYLKVEYIDKTNVQTAGSNQIYVQSSVTASLSANWQWIQKQESQAQGGNSGGNEPVTPSNPYETTFNGTYGYDFSGAETLGNGGSTEWVSTLDPNQEAYLRNDGSKIEVCGIYPTGTVCIAGGDYGSDFEDVTNDFSGITTIADLQATGLKGYSLAKAEEMLNKGASSCYVCSYHVDCYLPSTNSCNVYDFGNVYCSGWYVYSDGSSDGHPAP